MDFESIKTPCYIINEEEYINSINHLMNCFNGAWDNNVLFGYSIKTNHYPYLMNIAKKHKWYAEVVSKDEYDHAIANGFKSNNIILNGPNKKCFLSKAICEKGIVNLDNLDEVLFVCKNKDILKSEIGLRVNIDLEKYVPGETTVGKEVGRFGLCYENGDLKTAIDMLGKNNLKINGLHLHHSTSSRSLKVFKVLSKFAAKIAKEYKLSLDYIDIGGGLFGGNYFKNKPKINEYACVISKELRKSFNPITTKLIIEPGAAVLATSCDYLTSVINIRTIRETNVVTVDGSCLHVNPFMKPKQQNPCTIINPGVLLKKGDLQIIGGSTCMEMDRLYPMNNKYKLNYDSKLLFHCAGAYTMTHNSNFINTLPIIYVKKTNNYKQIRRIDVKRMSE